VIDDLYLPDTFHTRIGKRLFPTLTLIRLQYCRLPLYGTANNASFILYQLQPKKSNKEKESHQEFIPHLSHFAKLNTSHVILLLQC